MFFTVLIKVAAPLLPRVRRLELFPRDLPTLQMNAGERR